MLKLLLLPVVLFVCVIGILLVVLYVLKKNGGNEVLTKDIQVAAGKMILSAPAIAVGYIKFVAVFLAFAIAGIGVVLWGIFY